MSRSRTVINVNNAFETLTLGLIDKNSVGSLVRQCRGHRDATFGLARRALAIAVLLSLAPQVVTPAVAARQVSLKLIADWLALRVGYDGARGEDPGSSAAARPDADFIASVFASLGSMTEGGVPIDDLVRELGTRVIRVGAPPIVPPSLLGISSASASKWLPERSLGTSESGIAVPTATAVVDRPVGRATDVPRDDRHFSPAQPRGP